MSELNIILGRLDSMESGFGEVKARFDHMDKRFDSLEKKMNGRFDGVDKRFDQVDHRLYVHATAISELQETTKEMKESLDALMAASEKDTTGLMNHESRITGLERIQGIPSVGVKHLSNFDE